MLYDEYNKAAIRHLQACEVLLEQLKTNSSTSKKENILLETFYLTGYIFECIYKFAIFKLIRYDPKKDVKYLNENGISYTQIKIHDFKKLGKELNRWIGGDIPFVKHRDGIDKKAIELYDRWNPCFRYVNCMVGDESGIIKFFEWSKRTREKILDNI